MRQMPETLRRVIARNIRYCRELRFPGKGGSKRCADALGISQQQWSPWEIQIDGRIDEINNVEPLDKKWEAFGWHTQVVDGHDLTAIDNAIARSLEAKNKPAMIILKTIKGKGVSFIEEAGTGNHNMPIPADKRAIALEELKAGGR